MEFYLLQYMSLFCNFQNETLTSVLQVYFRHFLRLGAIDNLFAGEHWPQNAADRLSVHVVLAGPAWLQIAYLI